MKTNQEVADAWSMGYSAKSGTMFTDGVTIYSYGYHFPIATRTHGRILYNKRYYSPTTAKHQSCVRYALGRTPVVRCRDVNPIDNERYVRYEIDKLMRLIPKCRKIDDRVNDVWGELLEYELCLDTLSEKQPKWVREVHFAMENLKGKPLRIWCKNYKF